MRCIGRHLILSIAIVGGLVPAAPVIAAGGPAGTAAAAGVSGSGTTGPLSLLSVGYYPDGRLSESAVSIILRDQGPTGVTAGPISMDLYDARAERWQDPDYRACTAASTLSMLNTIAYRGADASLTWHPTVAYSEQETILAYERAHMTMVMSSAGTDPHGWRNALNYMGWGRIDAGVYQDLSYSSFASAAKAVVSAIAMYRKPVGILALAGGHAEFVTGYVVSGADPATGSTAFTVLGIYLTDPYRANGHRNLYVSYRDWQSGSAWVRFSAYRQSDSPYRDPQDGNVGRTEWYGKWVIVAPAR